MRFLADENIHSGMVEALGAAGHDVAWVVRDAPGSSDIGVLASANLAQRTLITYDTDFGELIFGRNFLSEAGVMLLRLTGTVDTHTGRVVDVVSVRDDWSQYFTTLSDERVRRRLLPRPH